MDPRNNLEALPILETRLSEPFVECGGGESLCATLLDRGQINGAWCELHTRPRQTPGMHDACAFISNYFEGDCVAFLFEQQVHFARLLNHQRSQPNHVIELNRIEASHFPHCGDRHFQHRRAWQHTLLQHTMVAQIKRIRRQLGGKTKTSNCRGIAMQERMQLFHSRDHWCISAGARLNPAAFPRKWIARQRDPSGTNFVVERPPIDFRSMHPRPGKILYGSRNRVRPSAGLSSYQGPAIEPGYRRLISQECYELRIELGQI